MPDATPAAEPDEPLDDEARASVSSGPPLIPSWIAVLVLVGMLLLAGAGGYALHAALNRSAEERLAELDAIESWRARVAEAPRDKQSRLALADALRESGELRSALAEYGNVLRDDPRDVAALYQRGMIFFALQQPADAVSSLWAVLNQDEGHVLAAEALGDYYASKEQYRSLLEAVRPAVTAHPTEARLQYLMGLAYENLGERAWAKARYRLALEAVPDMAEALEGLRRLETAR